MAQSAIHTPVITELVTHARELAERVSEAEEQARSLATRLEEAQQAAQLRRMEYGRHLLKARDMLPKRGTKEHGWGAFLEAIELDEATAWRYMKLAEAFTGKDPVKDKVPSYAELGLDKREGSQQPDAPPPTDADEPGPSSRMPDTANEVVIDRDTWCTPREFAELLGPWALDPCSNERSHIQAQRTFRLDRGEDGLELAKTVKPATRAFLNPPYSAVWPWIQAYGHTRFCFLLKLDPSTKWFADLYSRTKLILVPRGTRIEFEAPPGVPPEKALGNQFPHAFFFAREEDAPAALIDRCFVWPVVHAA